MGQADVQLFTALARVTEWRISDFNEQELTNTAWAFAESEQLDAQLFTALARAVNKSVTHFDAQDLANTAWAFVTAG